MTHAPPNELITVTTAGSVVKAHAVVAALEEAGIEAFSVVTHHVDAGSLLADAGRRVPVRVRPADLDRARSIVADLPPDAPDVDWETVDVGDRTDALPLRTPGRMPLPARIAFVITALVVLTAIVAGVIVLVV